jgi:hypothetical protein
MVPGRKVAVTDFGNAIDPRAIAASTRCRSPSGPTRSPSAAGERGRARDPAGGTVAASAAQAPSAPPEPASEGADPAIDWPASVSDADPPRSSGSREACDLTEPLG